MRNETAEIYMCCMQK